MQEVYVVIRLGELSSDVCFFFKQKTAYEMRISDWSSDVCSSDLGDIITVLALADDCFELIDQDHATFDIAMLLANHFARGGHCRGAEIGRAWCRERVCQYV